MNIEQTVTTAVASLQLGENFTFEALTDAVQRQRGREIWVAELAEITEAMAGDLRARHLPDGHRAALYELAEMTTYVTSRPTLSSEVIRAQVRSIVLDLLMVSGLTFEEALEGIPTSYSLVGDGDTLPGFVDDPHADHHSEPEPEPEHRDDPEGRPATGADQRNPSS